VERLGSLQRFYELVYVSGVLERKVGREGKNNKGDRERKIKKLYLFFFYLCLKKKEDSK